MLFDEHNAIVKLCARGMESEGAGYADEASALFHRAWDEARTDLEKCAAAHYLARHQQSVSDKLIWDRTALAHALKVADERIKGSYPSLYLNIGKCLEDLGDRERAHEQYRLALSYTSFLGQDGYGSMIAAGIRKGIERTTEAGQSQPVGNE
jgi:tetratricopeptide (TPR) repeat protein